MSKYTLKLISIAEVYQVRHPILRPNRPFSTCIFENDNDPKSIHLGAFYKKQLVGVLSAIPNNSSEFFSLKGMQFRGMAVVEDHRRKGVATALIEELFKRVKHKKQWDYVWLNARVNAILLYLNVGMKPTGALFDIPKIGPHQRFFKKL
ncbi:MAG: GNAT family N-acetyltransferase [Flavobacteriaceae bacterium]|nr:GNAT family N-acetyltransferase [Flavobacteriaceae bacterium]